MGQTSELDQTYCIIRDRMRETGQALHYTELALELGVPVPEGYRRLHELMAHPYPCWLHPGTDWFASFPPFSNIPTQYRVSVDGQQRWFAQCGFESLAVTWLFPGKTVRVDAYCVTSAAPLRIEVRDGKVLRAEPETIHGYVNIPMARWRENLPYT
jgi:hypothetical protein